jgi:hypothetical protein
MICWFLGSFVKEPVHLWVNVLLGRVFSEEGNMDAKLIAEADELLRTAERLKRVGLVVDPVVLSAEHRRAFFALQCREEEPEDQPQRTPPIGFAYPNAR